MTTATDMLAAYLTAETNLLPGKEVTFNGRRHAMEDLPAIRTGRQEWAGHVAAEQRPTARRKGLGNYAVARFDDC